MVENKFANPFEKSVRPVILRNGIANCSACMFRNAPKMCEKLLCEYDDNGHYAVAYWVPRNNVNHGVTIVSPELADWLHRTSVDNIREACVQVLQKAL